MFAMSQTDEEARRKDPKVFQLLDIIAEEVSDVDRAANKRTYLVVKRRTDMKTKEQLGAELVEDADGNLTTIGKAKADDDAEHDETKAASPDKEEDETKQALVIPAAVKQALLKATTEALQRLMAIVNAIKAAEETDEKLDKPTPDSVARELRAVSGLLVGALERYPSPIAKDDGATEVAKAGAKLAGKRRDQLKGVIELLQKLLEDVLPEKSAPRGAPPGDRSSTDPNRANVGAGVQPDRDAARSAQEVLSDVPGLADVLKSLSSLGEVMKELRSKVQGQDEQIARLKKSTGLPASREVDAVRRPKPQDDSVSWPLDMNRPLSREKIAKEVSFFDLENSPT
jgi:hypothetical protein